MSQFCKTQLCATVESSASEIASSDATTDFLFSAFAMDNLATNRTQKINFGSLPDASTVPNGQVAYLDDAKVPVIASNGTWIGFDGRTVGTFVENQLWVWGRGACGALGDGTTTAKCSPVREICLATDWCSVNTNRFSNLAIKTSGELWAWGANHCGQLGDGTATTRCSPVREFCSATDWCQAGMGCFHAAAVKTSGELWAWGLNYGGRLGDGTTTNRCSPVREFCSATDWCEVCAGGYHTVAVKTSGQIWTWGGGNIFGMLGDGTTTDKCSPVRERCSATNWCAVSAYRHTAAVKTSGQIWLWGLNGSFLGDGTSTNRCSPVREFCSATDWCQVSTTYNGTAAIKTTGELWAWGQNNDARLGDGTTTTRCSPVREFCSATNWCQVTLGARHGSGIKTSGQIWTWGYASNGELGIGTTCPGGTSRICSPVREFCSATDWCQVSAGNLHTTAIKSVTIVCR